MIRTAELKRRAFRKSRGFFGYHYDLLWLRIFSWAVLKRTKRIQNNFIALPFTVFVKFSLLPILHEHGKKGVIKAVQEWPDEFKKTLTEKFERMNAIPGKPGGLIKEVGPNYEDYGYVEGAL